jgi:hypothetical protein
MQERDEMLAAKGYARSERGGVAESVRPCIVCP